MTIKTPSHDTSPSNMPRNRRGSRPRIDDERADADVTADHGRDLAHGEGGTIDLPTKPGDVSKDD